MSTTAGALALTLLLGLAPTGIQAQTQEPTSWQEDQQQTAQPNHPGQTAGVTAMGEKGLLAGTIFSGSLYSPHGDIVAPINDVVVTFDGEVEGVLIDVASWLGIEREVLVSMQDLSLETVDGELRLVTQRSREELHDEPEFRRADDAPMRIPQLARPQPGVPPEALPPEPHPIVLQDERSVLAGTMIGTSVHSVIDGEIGEINDVIVSMTGQVEGLVVGMGGFLGFGEKEVVLPMERLHIERTDDGRVRASVRETREELDAAEDYEPPRPGALQ